MKTTIIAALVALLAGCAAAQPAPKTTAPTAAPTQTQANATDQGDVQDGQSRSGEIVSADEQDTYDIDLGDATEFELVEVQGEVDFKIATQEETSSKGNGLPGPNQFGVSAPGKHKLVVSGHEGVPGKYSFRLVTIKKRQLESEPGEIKGSLDVPGRVNVHVIEAANVVIEDGKPCEDIQLGFSTDPADEAKTYTPHYVCWNPKHESENGKTQILIWSESGRTGDYSFTVRER
ncbi:hypothetical protein LFM09_15365 [Lentzea alba]|uniref:hypothetical protein n=1 Tax=Lentzea alba TaxID=2714351 RepID=UPI0039BFE1FB